MRPGTENDMVLSLNFKVGARFAVVARVLLPLPLFSPPRPKEASRRQKDCVWLRYSL